MKTGKRQSKKIELSSKQKEIIENNEEKLGTLCDTENKCAVDFCAYVELRLRLTKANGELVDAHNEIEALRFTLRELYAEMIIWKNTAAMWEESSHNESRRADKLYAELHKNDKE